MATIYENVEDLLERVGILETSMTTVQGQIETLGFTTLTEDADLNALEIGNYIIPTTTVCASLLNKPAGSNTATGFIKVVSGGSAGQLNMYYVPCAKEGASYYQRAYYQEAWGEWHHVDVYDSGWVDMALSGDVIAFNDEQKPRYRRIGNTVFLTGVVKNISAAETVIATLPANFRPSKKVIIAEPSTGTKFSRISIQTNGVIAYEQSNDNTVAATNWHSLACSFCVD